MPIADIPRTSPNQRSRTLAITELGDGSRPFADIRPGSQESRRRPFPSAWRGVSTVDDLQLRPEILEAAAEIASLSEAGGLPAPFLARLLAALARV